MSRAQRDAWSGPAPRTGTHADLFNSPGECPAGVVRGYSVEALESAHSGLASGSDGADGGASTTMSVSRFWVSVAVNVNGDIFRHQCAQCRAGVEEPTRQAIATAIVPCQCTAAPHI